MHARVVLGVGNVFCLETSSVQGSSIERFHCILHQCLTWKKDYLQC